MNGDGNIIYDTLPFNCKECQTYQGQVNVLLEHIMAVGKKFGIIREDLSVEEFCGPTALHVLEILKHHTGEWPHVSTNA